jgi:hypothetical protein
MPTNSLGCDERRLHEKYQEPGSKNGSVYCYKRHRGAFLALVSIIEGRNPARTAMIAAIAFPVEKQSLGPTPVLRWGEADQGRRQLMLTQPDDPNLIRLYL